MIWNRCALIVVLVLAAVGCARPDTGYRESDELPGGYLGESYQAWAEGSKIQIEVITYSGLNTVSIEHRLEDDTIYLFPRQCSCGAAGQRRYTIDLSDEDLKPGWKDRVYWLTETPVSIWEDLPWVRVKLRLEAG